MRKVVNRLVPVVWLLLMVADAGAQVNTEAMRATDVEGWTVTVSADGALRTGNTEVVEVGGALRVDYRADRHYTFIVGRSRYSEAEGATTQNDAFGHVRYNYQLQPWLVGEAFGQAQRDALTLLQLRLLAGTGVRLRYLRGPRLEVFQGTSIMAEHENLEPTRANRHPAEVTVARWSNYVSARVSVNERVQFNTTAYVQPRLDAFADVRILVDVGLQVGLTDHLAFSTTLNLQYDSRPPSTVEPLDLVLRNGISVTF